MPFFYSGLRAKPALRFVLDAGALPLPRPQPREIRRVCKAIEGELLMLDLLLVAPVYQDVWDSRSWFDWNGLHLPAVTAAGLAKMKALAGRYQDLADLEKLGYDPDDPSLQS